MWAKLNCGIVVILTLTAAWLQAAEVHPLGNRYDQILNFSSGQGNLTTMPVDRASNNNREFTIAFWFKADKLPELNYDQRMAGYAGLFSRQWNQDCRLSSSGTIGVLYQMPKEECNLRAQGILIEPKVWYHFAVTYSVAQQSARIYIDGRCEGEKKDHLVPIKALDQTPLMLGHSETWNRFDGSLCAISIFDEALSPDHIRKLAEKLPPRVKKAALKPVVYRLNALSANPVTPQQVLPAEQLTDRLHLTLAPGEYESAACALRCPGQAMNNLTFTISDFAAKHGRIPAAAATLQLVKCWYQAGGAWVDVFVQAAKIKKLVPELLLNDNALVMVDTVAEQQALRYSYPDNIVYKSIINPGAYNGMSRFTMELPVKNFPICDAKTLQPFSLGAGFLQEMFLTVHAPEDARPGNYTASLGIQERGQPVAEVKLQLTVLPFKLAAPRTAYDLNQEFIPSVYYLSVLRPGDGSLNPHQRSQEQYRAELADLKAHGIDNPFCYQLTCNDLSLFRQALQMRRAAGMPSRPLFLHAPEGNLGMFLKNDAASLAKIKAQVTELLQITEQELGHRDVYFYGVDEARGDRVKTQLPIWKTIHEAGGKVFTSDESSNHAVCSLPGSTIDLVVAAWNSSRATADLRHRNGGRIFMYFTPQGGVENPDVYRRNYGLRLWLDHYDGFATYCYFEAFGNPWDDFDCGMRDHNFVYPTADGVVDTVEWAGYREAIDDIRYATTLREAAVTARKNGKAQLADQAEKWLASIDAEHADLDQVRKQMIDWILKLKK